MIHRIASRHTWLWSGISSTLVIIVLASTLPAHLHAQITLLPITVDNIAQVRLLMSLNGQSPVFNPDGSRLASRAYRIPQVWDIETSQALPMDSPGEIRQWSADGTRLVPYDSDTDIPFLWPHCGR